MLTSYRQLWDLSLIVLLPSPFMRSLTRIQLICAWLILLLAYTSHPCCLSPHQYRRIGIVYRHIVSVASLLSYRYRPSPYSFCCIVSVDRHIHIDA